MPAQREELTRAIEELARYVVALEAGIGSSGGSASGAVIDTPALGVLLALDLFGSLRPSALAQLLAMHSGTTTKRIDRLERAGLVSRATRPVPGDRRGVVVEITDAGRHEIARVEEVAVTMGDELRLALRPLMAATAETGAGPALVGTAPVLAGLLRFVSLLDQSAIRGIGAHHVLHPSDPRPLLLLADLDRNGPRPPGSLPALIDRSRTATHRLVRRMADDGLVATAAVPGPGSRALVRVSPRGRRVLGAVLTALDDDMADIGPALAELVAALDASVRSRAADGGR